MCWRSGQTDCTGKTSVAKKKNVKGSQARCSGVLPSEIARKKLGWRLTPLGEPGLSFGMYGTEYAAGRRLEVDTLGVSVDGNSNTNNHSQNSRKDSQSDRRN